MGVKNNDFLFDDDLFHQRQSVDDSVGLSDDPTSSLAVHERVEPPTIRVLCRIVYST